MGRVMSGEAGAYNFDSYAAMKDIRDILGGSCGAGVVETTAQAAQRVVNERDAWRKNQEFLAAKVEEIGDEDSELRQKAAAWDVVAEHPVIGEISTLPDADTYADQVYARLDEIATEREPWDVLREAANYLDVPGRFDVSESVRGYADRLEREAAVKSQRDAEVEKALKAWHHVGAESLAENSDELERECMRAALDAVRGDSDE